MTRSIHVAAVLCLCASWSAPSIVSAREIPIAAGASDHQAAPAPPASVTAADVATSLAGLWKAPEDRMERYSQLDVEVFGPHAVDVRNVDLTVQPSGEAVLKVTTKVVDQKGRTYSPTLVEAKLRIGAAARSIAGLIQPVVTVVSAEERYLDSSGDHFSRDGSKVELTMTDLAGDELNLRFDPSDGRGSFGTTLKRQPSRAHKR